MNYRPDIDGLRAYAVLGVVIYHLNPAWLSGGYVGVDVFFVISGYLITRQVMLNLKKGKFSLQGFYLRRLRRLYPAAAMVTVLTALAGYKVLPPTLLPDLWGSVVYTAVSLANVFFWTKSGYFEADALTKPLLHMWSLGVEEQFYLIWPGLLALLAHFSPAKKFRRTVFAALIVISALSFWAAQRSLDSSAESAFFLTHLRAWEFAIGALLTVMQGERRLPLPIAQVSLFVGLGLVSWSAFTFSDETLFPGASALLPTLGTALVIAAGAPPVTSWLLKNPLAVGIGKISYSVYLVHWPLIVLAEVHSDADLTLMSRGAIAVASLIGGYLSWRFVEQPFRHRSGKRNWMSEGAFGTACGISALILTVGAASAWAQPPAQSNPNITQRNERMLRYLDEQNSWTKAYTLNRICYAVGGESYDAEFCMDPSGEESPPDILIFGDSLAANMYAGVDAHFAGRANVDLAASPSCRPVFKNSAGTRACQSRNQAVLREADLTEYELVIVRGNFIKKRYIEDIPKTVRLLRERGARHVVLWGPAVEYKTDMRDLLSKHAALEHEELVAILNAQVQERTFRTDGALRKAAAKARIPFVSSLSLRCPNLEPTGCAHTIGRAGDPITRDKHHPTYFGALWELSQVERLGAPWRKWLKNSN